MRFFRKASSDLFKGDGIQSDINLTKCLSANYHKHRMLLIIQQKPFKKEKQNNLKGKQDIIC